jgi:hypothetical protein
MGSGQPNRVKSVQIALEKAADEVKVGSAPPVRRQLAPLLLNHCETTLAVGMSSAVLAWPVGGQRWLLYTGGEP